MSIDELRRRIDGIDDKILELLKQRSELARGIGKLKKANNQPVQVPWREQNILRRLKEGNHGSFPDAALEKVYREIMSACRDMEMAVRVAYLGPEATFSHEAALLLFGSDGEYLPMQGIEEVFAEVEKGKASYGVVPVENSMAGVVGMTLDLFVDSDLTICAERLAPISHNLLSKQPLDEIVRVYSKDMAFAQCRSWLRSNLPRAELIEVGSTAKGAERAASEEGAAAIASRLASEMMDVPIVAEDIQDHSGNYTRFVALGREFGEPTGKDKTSILFMVRHKVGALYHALKPFDTYKLNLTTIVSRPNRRRAWEYVFFVDFMGHVGDEMVAKALEEVREECLFLKVLGSYPTE